MLNDNALRAAIRLLPPTRALKEQLEKSLMLETYQGTGDIAVNSLRGLQSALSRLSDDPYIAALTPMVSENASDREKVSQALLIAAQLQGYIEGETGLAGSLEGGSKTHLQTAPNVAIQNITGVPNIGAIMEKALTTEEKSGEDESK
jgi:hypothetical protein